MNKKTAILLSLIVTFFSAISGYALPQKNSLEVITTTKGLNNSTVYHLARGQKGYTWMATDMGISRYDGFRFRNYPCYQNASSATQTLPQAVRKIYSNKNGLFFLTLQKGGMACFDAEQERYLPVVFENSFDGKKVNCLYIAEQSILYIATTEGLYSAEMVRVGSGENEKVQLTLAVTPIIKGDVRLLRSDDNGNLFFSINQAKVVHYTMGTRQTEVVYTCEDTQSLVSTLYVADGHLWICRKFGDLAFYDYTRKTLRTLNKQSEEATQLANTFVTDIARINDSTYYISTWKGLYSITFESKSICDVDYKLQNVLANKYDNHFSVEGKMTSLLWDDSQKFLWAGTFGGGAVKLNFNEDIYHRLKSIPEIEITGIQEDSQGYLWLTSKRRGVWRSSTNSLSENTAFLSWNKGVNPNEGYLMYKDRNGALWLADEHAGIIYIDPLTGESKSYRLAPAGTRNFAGNVRAFCLDSRDQLWLATTQGLICFDNKTGNSSLIISLEGDVKAMTAVAEDKEGDLWIGTNIGVKRLDMSSDKARLVGEYEASQGMNPAPVSLIYVNSYNLIFVAYADKVIRIDGRDKEKVERLFTLNGGLSSTHLYCVVDDHNGNTWMGSNSGIMTIRNDCNSFFNYSLSGYCNNVCRLRDGRLLWTDSWGLFFFDPLAVKIRRSTNQPLLSDLWVNGKSVEAGKEVNGQVILHSAPESQKEFVFSSSNNNLRFYFSDMQYYLLQRKIAYRMLPNEEWNYCSIQDPVRYSNLPVGKYTLQVKLVYPDVPEGKVLDIPIVIEEYWWKTIWAIMAYLLLASGALFAYFRYREAKRAAIADIPSAILPPKTDRQEELQQHLLNKQGIDNFVATRLVEEFRTPLSMIIAPLREVLQEKELSKGLSTKMLVAYRNSMAMQNTCDQILGIFKYAPKETLEVAPYSIVKLTDAFVFSMSDLLRILSIEFKYEKKVKNDLEVWVDKKAFLIVLHNMLANAFIHLRYSGAVVLILQETIEDERHYCTLSVVDNGKADVKIIESGNMNAEEINKFDSTELELGYAVMQQIMEQHHGSIFLENVRGSGTKIQIKFPIDKTVFDQDPNVVFVDSENEKEVLLPEKGMQILDSEEHDELLLSEDLTDTVTNHQSRTRKTILVVEDYKDIRFYLKTLFEREYNVLLAVNGAEGVDMARNELPDLVISDIMMPVKDGYDCCREIKEGLDTCHIPVILLTAKVEDEDIVRGLEIGADDYILKPFTPQILKAKVKNLIEGRTNLKSMYTRLLVTPEQVELPENSAEKEEIEDPFISTVVKIIEENIQEPDFNVKKLASDLNMSQPTLYRKVKQCTDFTIIELIRGVRMKKAAILLKKKQYPVQEVAEMVGYNDIPTFRKHFVDTYGTTPSTFADSSKAEKE